jgi:hypothetical protein
VNRYSLTLFAWVAVGSGIVSAFSPPPLDGMAAVVCMAAVLLFLIRWVQLDLARRRREDEAEAASPMYPEVQK